MTPKDFARDSMETGKPFARVEECYWSDGSRRDNVCKVWIGDYFVKYCDTKKEADEEANLITAAHEKAVQERVEEATRELRALVKEWLCVKCRTVYPGPPQPGVYCVQCPRCHGDCGPREFMEQRERIEKAVKEAVAKAWEEAAQTIDPNDGDCVPPLRAAYLFREKAARARAGEGS